MGIPLIALLVVLSINMVELIKQKIYWAIAKEKAKQIADVGAVIDGFTALFRRYVATRSLAIHGFIWSAYGAFGSATFAYEMMPAKGLMFDTLSLAVLTALIALTILNFLIAYLISRGFRIGEVLVDFLSIITYRSANPMHTQEAETETHEIVEEQRRVHYWWFF
jgi:hypothetical protein